MSKSESNEKEKGISENSGNNFSVEFDSLNLLPEANPKEEYFLGFRVKNRNELWRWDTLEDVKF